jgi:hypothetical protein
MIQNMLQADKKEMMQTTKAIFPNFTKQRLDLAKAKKWQMATSWLSILRNNKSLANKSMQTQDKIDLLSP